MLRNQGAGLAPLDGMRLMRACMERAAATLILPVGECGSVAAAGYLREGDQVPAPPRLLDVVRRTARTHHLSRRTEKAYVGWIRRYVARATVGVPRNNKRRRSLMQC